MTRPSPSMVVALIALFVALGGTSYAVIKLPAKSVGSRELKSNAVSSTKIRPRAVSRSDLALSARSGSRGPRGPVGPSGDAVAPEPWKALPFSAGWDNFGNTYAGGAYRKDARGRVYLRGLVTKVAGSPASEEVIATLPSGYRPTARLLFAVGGGATSVANAYGRVDVLADGRVLWEAGINTAETDITGLDNVSFWTD